MEVQPVQCTLYNTSIQYRGKQLRLFMAGDYEYLSKLYGLSGATGMYMYMYCCNNDATALPQPTIISKKVVPYTCMVA